jgi:hypothetical protein
MSKMQRFITTGVAVAAIGLSGTAWAVAQPLVDVAWIKANSCNDGVRVLDIRNALDGGSQTEYLRGHIPCAVHTDYMKDGWRVADKNKTPGQLPPAHRRPGHRQRYPGGDCSGGQGRARHGQRHADVLDLQGAGARQRFHPQRRPGGLHEG